jgi:hypothetical protein
MKIIWQGKGTNRIVGKEEKSELRKVLNGNTFALLFHAILVRGF